VKHEWNVEGWAKSIIAVALLPACICAAQASEKINSKIVWVPVEVDWGESLPDPTVVKEKVPRARIDGFRIVLDETKLENAANHFGEPIERRGDAGTAEGWICLQGSDAGGRWIFWLSSFEINGQAIGGIEWSRLAANESADPRCKIVGKNGTGIQLPVALHLGMKEAEVRSLLGQPTTVREHTLIYCHRHEEVINQRTYDASNDVAIVLRDGRVWIIQTTKTVVD
jgi:hypothetical protein